MRTEDGLANWAAAADPAFVRESGSPAEAIARMLDEAGVDTDAPTDGWKGTPALTRRSPAREGVVFRVGDASGYVEPITGEGMSWALSAGVSAASAIERELAGGRAAWERASARMSRVRRARCWAVSRGLRSPLVMRAAMALLSRDDRLGGSVVASLIGGGTVRA